MSRDANGRFSFSPMNMVKRFFRQDAKAKNSRTKKAAHSLSRQFFDTLEDRTTPATHIWIGPIIGNWSNGANWTNGVPTSGEANGTVVQFNGTTLTTQDLPGLVVNEIHFTAGGNTIVGNTSLGISGLAVSNNIVNDAGANLIATSVPLVNSGATTFVLVSSGSLTIDANISGNQSIRLRPGSAGSLTFTGSNSYTGDTFVDDGTLILDAGSSNDAIGTGDLTIGDSNGAAGTATVELGQSVEIPNTSSVTVNSDGRFDFNGFSDTFGPLTITDGTVALSSGTLVLTGALSMTGGDITGTGTLTLGGDVTAISDAATGTANIFTDISLNGSTRTFTVNFGPSTPDLNLAGKITGTGSLIKAGTGFLEMSGAEANDYTGTTFVNDGRLRLNKNSVDFAVPHNLVIGDTTGTANSAIVQFIQSQEISNTSTVTINGDGQMTMATFSDTINNLIVNNGSILTGGGSLSMTGTMTYNGSGSDDALIVTATDANSGTIAYNGGSAWTFNLGGTFSFNGLVGNDTLTINNPVLGLFAPTGGAFFDGGVGTNDTLQDIGGGNAITNNGSYTPGASNGDGVLTYTLGATTQTINFSNLSPVNDTVAAASFVINATAGADDINIINGPVVSATTTTQVNSGASSTFELINFANKTNVTVNGLAGVDVIVLNNSNPAAGLDTLTIDSGDGNDNLTVQRTSASYSTTLNSTAGNGVTDTVLISNNGLLTSIGGPVQVINNSGFTNLTIDDHSDAVARNATLDIVTIGNQIFGQLTGLGNAGAITYRISGTGDTNSLSILGGTGGNSFLVNQISATTHAFTTTLNSGTGADSVNVRATGSGITYVVQGQQGVDTVVVGSLAPTATGGTLLNINGPVEVRNANSLTNLTIDDSGDAVARPNVVMDTTTLSAQSFGRVTGMGNGAEIRYRINTRDIGTLTVNAGSGGNTILLNQTLPASGSMTTNLNTGTGLDAVNIRATSQLVAYVVQGQNSNDSVVIGSLAPTATGGTLASINGPVDIRNANSFTSLVLDDSGSVLPRNGTLDNVLVGADTFGRLNGWGNTADIRYRMNTRDVSSVTINGGSGGNTLAINQTLAAGSAFTTTINSGTGTDSVNLQAAASLVTYNINGQAGGDTFVIGGSNGKVNITDTAGADVLSFTTSPAAVTFDLSQNAGQVQNFGSGNQLSIAGAFETLIGSGFADSLKGGAAADSISAGAGNDTVFGGGGADTLIGGTGNDSLDGDTENDFIVGGDGNDTILGGQGDDLAFGQAGLDSLVGDIGNDSFDGGDNNDTISGGAGNDYIVGGLGADSLVGNDDNDGFDAGDGDDFLDGGLGNDFMYGMAGNDTMLGQDGADGMDAGLGNDSVDGGLGNDFMYGLDGNDTMLGGDGNDGMDGGAGDDLMFGQAGNDLLFGAAGNDSEAGGIGDDSMNGDAGNDTLDGGTGNDLIFSSGGGIDFIQGNDGNDTLQNIDSNCTIYGGAGDDVLYGANFIGDSLVGDDGNDVFFGLSGNDTITTGAGLDTVDGGAGTDAVLDASVTDVLFNIP